MSEALFEAAPHREGHGHGVSAFLWLCDLTVLPSVSGPASASGGGGCM